MKLYPNRPKDPAIIFEIKTSTCRMRMSIRKRKNLELKELQLNMKSLLAKNKDFCMTIRDYILD